MSVTAWILRYVQSLRFKRKPKKKIDPLTSDELERGEEFWIKIAISGYAFSNTYIMKAQTFEL